MSTSSQFLFGFPVSGRHPFFRKPKQIEETIYWKDFLARKHGLRLPRRLKRYSEEEFEERMDRYCARYHAIMDSYGCSLREVGDHGEPEYFVEAAIAGPAYMSGRSNCIRPIDMNEMLQVMSDAEVRAKLRRFCKALGLRYRTPRWYKVVSYYRP